MNINISDLGDGVIVITKWHVELAVANSSEEFASYAGIEMRMIISDFKVKINDQSKLSKYPVNLYRDDDVKVAIQNFVREKRVAALCDLLKKPIEKTSKASSITAKNTIFIGNQKNMGLSVLEQEEKDQFVDYSFLRH